MASGFLGHLMNNARESEQRRKEREAQMEQQRLEMMKQGYDVSDTPQLTPGQQMASALQRGLNYDAQRDDPTPTYIRNQYNADVIARDRANQEMEESEERILSEKARREGLGYDNEMKQLELDGWKEEREASLNQMRSLTARNKADEARLESLTEATNYDRSLLEQAKEQNDELRQLQIDKAKVDLLSANHSFYRTEDGSVFSVNYKEGKMTRIVDGATDPEKAKLIEAVTLANIAKTIDDSDLRELIEKRIEGLMQGKSIEEQFKEAGGIDNSAYLEIPLYNNRPITPSVTPSTPVPASPPEKPTPMGGDSTDDASIPAFLKQSKEPPLLQLINYLNGLYNQSQEGLINAGLNRRAEQQ